MGRQPRVLRQRSVSSERLLEATETATGTGQGVRPAWAGAGQVVHSWVFEGCKHRCQCQAHLADWVCPAFPGRLPGPG